MRRQLSYRHHALGNHMPEATGVLRGKPAHGQARDMLADALPRPLQYGHADCHPRPVQLEPPRPANGHAGQHQAEPQRSPSHIPGQQVIQHRHQRGEGQAA